MQREMHQAVIQGDATMAMGHIKRNNVQVIDPLSKLRSRVHIHFAEPAL